jgi:hypothetical protein
MNLQQLGATVRERRIELGLNQTQIAAIVELQRKLSHYLQPILSHQFLNNLA